MEKVIADTYMWVSFHRDIEGNKEGDQLNKRGSLMEISQVDATVYLPPLRLLQKIYTLMLQIKHVHMMEGVGPQKPSVPIVKQILTVEC